MAPPREIPGFFYDENKKKYFKIEQSGPPAASQYSAQNVKKRKAEARDKAVKARRAAIPGVIPDRSNPLAHPIVGGLFRHDLGEHPPDLARACWADGLQFKGAINLGNEYSQHRAPHVTSFLVSGTQQQDGEGLLVAATADGETTNYVFSRDRYNHVRQDWGGRSTEAAMRIPIMPMHVSGLVWGHQSDTDTGWPILAYSSAELTDALVTGPFMYLSRHPTSTIVEQSTMEYRFDFPAGTTYLTPILSCAAAPGGARGIMAAVGTSRGLATIEREETMSHVGFAVRSPGRGSTGNSVLALDFVNDHPDVLVLGGRGGTGIWTTDLREAERQIKYQGDNGTDLLERPPACHPGRYNERYSALRITECTTLVTRMKSPSRQDILHIFGDDRHTNARQQHSPFCRWLEVSREAGGAVNHVVSINSYQVLAAGISNRMDVWDVRRGFTQPCTTFPGYRNPARVGGMGLAVNRKLGIVAAANDHGPDRFCPVKLHSLATGREIPCRGLDAEAQHGQSDGFGPMLGIPSPCVRWETLPGDSDLSLFISHGTRVLKYTVGVETGIIDEF